MPPNAPDQPGSADSPSPVAHPPVGSPSADPDLVGELAELSVRLATGAGELVRAGRAGAFAVSTKSTTTDPVTDVDRDVERWLVARIGEARPGDAVLGEEQGGRDGTSGVRWVLDPIDGTVNFVLGLPEYAVSVAAEIGDTVVAGCVHNPVSGATYRAVLGGGAYLRIGDGPETALAGGRSVPVERAVVGTGFGYDRGRRARQGEVVARLLPRVADIRRLGSASLDICAVAAGVLDGHFEAGLNHWDSAAGLLVATEAGCAVSGMRGRAPGRRMTVVESPALAGALVRLLEELDADAV